MPPTRRKPSATQDDPLADLRENVPAGRTPPPAPEPDTQADPVARIIAAWHRDDVALGFLHGGGRCGCRYVARLVASQE